MTALRSVGKCAVPEPRHSHPRSCFWCAHYDERGGLLAAVCTHPAYRVPTPWREAIAKGQPCGGDNAPLWSPRQ